MHCYSSIPASEHSLTLQQAVLCLHAFVQAQLPLLYLQVKKSRSGHGTACLAADYWTAVEKYHGMWIWCESPANHNLSLLVVSSSGCVNTAIVIYLGWGLTGWRTRKQNFHGHPKAALPLSKDCPAHVVTEGVRAFLSADCLSQGCWSRTSTVPAGQVPAQLAAAPSHSSPCPTNGRYHFGNHWVGWLY